MAVKVKVLPTLERSKLEELADEWLADVKTNRSPRTVASYEWPVRRLAIPFMEAERLGDPAQLDQAALNRLSNSLADRNLSQASVASYLRQINVWIRWCAERDGRPNAFVAKWQKPIRKEREILTVAEIRALEDATTNARDALIVKTLAQTGMRLGELLGLAPEDVRGPVAAASIHVTGTKIRKERDVPIGRDLYRGLTDYIEKKRPKDTRSKALFLTQRRGRRSKLYEGLSKRTVETLFKTLAEVAGIKGPERVHPHALRHSLATRSQQKGANSANPAQMAAALGHSPAVFMATYAHLRGTDAREALAGLVED
jgi:integrase/recombinase XerC